MRIVIVAIGSVGDVAPYTGLGGRLAADGHRVAIAGYARFADLVQRTGLEFRPLPGDAHTMLSSSEGQRWLRTGTGLRGMTRMFRLLAQEVRALNRGMVDAAEGADLLLLSMTATTGYHVAEALDIPSMGVYLQPLMPTRAYPPSVVTPPGWAGGWANRALGVGVLTAMGVQFNGVIADLRADLRLPRLTARDARTRMARWPILHGYSPTVLPRPDDWPDVLRVCGYWWPEPDLGWTPPADLTAFLADGPAPVYIGFGSMNPDRAADVAAMAADTLRRLGLRGLFQSGWAGLKVTGDDMLTVDAVPHHWLFPRTAAVVHHGGAGTVAAALRAGVPSLALPVIADQRFWADRLTALGVGPATVPLRRITATELTDAVRALTTEKGYRTRATEIAATIEAEDGAGTAAAALRL
jgi:sterol 3beta-glucosyltransferase